MKNAVAGAVVVNAQPPFREGEGREFSDDVSLLTFGNRIWVAKEESYVKGKLGFPRLLATCIVTHLACQLYIAESGRKSDQTHRVSDTSLSSIDTLLVVQPKTHIVHTSLIDRQFFTLYCKLHDSF